MGKHCVPVDWKLLVSEDDVPAHDHIRCHQLREGDVLSMLLTKFEGQRAKVLVIINTEDNYSIKPHFMKGRLLVHRFFNDIVVYNILL